MSRLPLYGSEADLCAHFIETLPKDWTAYPETAGFDILVVHRDGRQVGIEAKIRLNIDVINQIIEPGGWWAAETGPDYRAVLVPSGTTQKFQSIASHLGVTVITGKGRRGHGYGPYFSPCMPEPHRCSSNEIWHERLPMRRCDLPEYVPDVAAGMPAPVKLTDWKIRAIKLMIILDRRGYVTRSDFRALQLDHRRWMPPHGYLRLGNEGWVLPEGKKPWLQIQHPDAWEKILADADKWMPPEPRLIPAVGQLL